MLYNRNSNYISNILFDSVPSDLPFVGVDFIVNEGKLVDFDFVGGSITGGTLAGKIINLSKVGGFFKDVDLAANSRLIGGTLKGEIKGECEAPALLEYLTIKANSYVECVILGEGVILGKKVTLVDVFPILSQVEIINAQGEKVNTLFAISIPKE